MDGPESSTFLHLAGTPHGPWKQRTVSPTSMRIDGHIPLSTGCALIVAASTLLHCGSDVALPSGSGGSGGNGGDAVATGGQLEPEPDPCEGIEVLSDPSDVGMSDCCED